MKNFKKIISLALVVVMVLSMMTIAGAAKLSEYTDYSSISTSHHEAVDLMSAVGILQGYEDGSFGPQKNVSREEAAKIITYMLIGQVAADRLSTSSSSFTDVAATRWSAPYIEYCVTQGIIDGVGNGKFNPTGNVTHSQFAKMLLTAVGYGKKDEYVGKNWELNTIADAQRLRILTLDRDYSAAANREDIAHEAFSAYGFPGVDMVALDKETDSYVYVQYNISGYMGAATLADLQFVNMDTAVREGVGYRSWSKYNVTLTGSYLADTLLGSSTNGTAIATLTNMFNAAYIASTEFKTNDSRLKDTFGNSKYKFDVYFNGANISDAYFAAAPFAAATVYTAGQIVTVNGVPYMVRRAIAAVDFTAATAAADAIAANAISLLVKNGSIVDFYSTDVDANAEAIVITEKTVGRVTKAPVVSDGLVTIGGIADVTKKSVLATVYPTDLAKDDVVLYYTSAQTFTTYIEKAESAVGQKTRSYANGSVLFSGETRFISGLPGSIANDGGFAFSKDATVWFDDNGNIAYYEMSESALADTYCIVLANGTGLDATARVLFMDGTVKTISLAYVNDVSSAISSFVAPVPFTAFYAYSENPDGTYNLNVLNPASPPTNITVTTIAGNIVQASRFDGSNLGDTNTVFLRQNPVTGAYVATTGVATAPKTTGGTSGLVLNYKGTAAYVYINAAGGYLDATETSAYILGTSTGYSAANGADPAYNSFNAIVDGAVVELKALTNVSTITANGVYTYAVNAAGYVVSAALNTNTTPNTASTTPPATAVNYATLVAANCSAGNGNIVINGQAYSTNSETKIFTITAKGVVTELTLADAAIIASAEALSAIVQYTPSTTDSFDMLATIYIGIA